jgi:5-methylcytosine-specific restriction enzyme A
MPRKPKKPCSYPRCPELTESRYCDAHTKNYDREYERQRGTSTQRGYGANHRRLRKMVLAQEPLCRYCTERGDVEPATELDHIDGNQWNLKWENLQGLCKSCHSRKTVKEQGALGRGRQIPGAAATETGWAGLCKKISVYEL